MDGRYKVGPPRFILPLYIVAREIGQSDRKNYAHHQLRQIWPIGRADGTMRP